MTGSVYSSLKVECMKALKQMVKSEAEGEHYLVTITKMYIIYSQGSESIA